MNIYGDRQSREAAVALFLRRVAASDLRHRYDVADLKARAELKPIIHITTPCHSRHNRPYGVREWGVFLDGRCIAYIAATQAGQLRLWPCWIGENHYQIDGEAFVTITDAQIRALRAAAVRRGDWKLAQQCDTALRRLEDTWLREPLVAALASDNYRSDGEAP